jgi:hypothetical protein
MKCARVLPGAAAVVACALLGSAIPARAEVVTLTPSKDNTLYQSTSGSQSNGAGQHFFVGRTDAITAGSIRRAVIAFDVAAAIPAGAVITRVDLTLNMSRTISALQPVSLHRLLADWGEGTSDALGEEGGGTSATTGDATWIHRFFNTVFWSGAGAAGDFVTTASTTIQVGGLGVYTFLSTPAMVADVQAWLDTPAASFGWILIGNESTNTTTKRFDSKDNPISSTWPRLTVEFSTGQVGAGSVPDGGRVPGTPLTVEPAADGAVRLSWGASCVAGDTDYAIYAGLMGDFTRYAPKSCSTGGATSLTFTPAAESEFYLVVPHNGTSEGSYGHDSGGGPRPPGGPACLPQVVASCP